MGELIDAFVGRHCFFRVHDIRQLRIDAKTVRSGCIFNIIFALVIFADDLFCDRRNFELFFDGAGQKAAICS